MPRNGSGTFSLVSGNPVVSGTTIESNWANTTLSDIATTLTDSLSRSGQGGMTAALRLADGTQGAPGVGFANETGSGVYRAGTGEVWAVVQGAQTLKLDASGVYVPADKTTTVDGAFVFNEAGADKDARFEGDTDANLLFTDASTDRVGIGTNTPSTKLHVVGDVTVSGAVNAATVNATTLDLTNIEVTNIKAKDGTAAATISDSTGVVNFAANVGVGASTPTFGSGSGVEIERAGIATLRLENSSASNSFELYADSAANGINLRGRDSSPMNFWTGNTLNATLSAAGNLGVGASSPTNKVDVVGSDGQGVQFRTGTRSIGIGQIASQASLFWGSGTDLTFFAGSELARLTSAGNLGIGTSSPGSKLDVSGNVNASNYQILGSNASQAGTFGFLNSNGPAIQVWGSSSANAGAMVFNTAGTERARLDSSGNLGLGVTPSAWGAPERFIDIGNTVSVGRGSSAQALVLFNSFINSSGQYIYKVSSFASAYEQLAGQHKWLTAPSGTAGNTISFTQAMTLDAGGNLGIGVTSPAYKVDVAADSAAIGLNVRGRAADDIGVIRFATNGNTETAAIDVRSGLGMLFATGSSRTERARITSAGDFIHQVNGTAPSLSTNSTMSFELTSNTSLKIVVRGTDGVTRSASLTLA